MNEVIVRAPSDLNISYLIEAANDVLVHSKDDISYFESLKNKKWYHYLFEKITFNKDNELRKANGVLNIAKMQDIIVKILLQLSESRNEIYAFIANNSSLIEELSQSNLYIQKQQKAIIAILKQIKYQESYIPKYQDLSSKNADIIFATLQKLAQESSLHDKNNELTQQYLRTVLMCNPVNPSFNFDNLDEIENLGVQIRQRLAIMLYEYLYLADADDTIQSDVLDRISPHLKQVARDNVNKSTQLMGKEVLILQYEKIETVEKVSEDGLIYSSSTDKTEDCIEVIDISTLKENACAFLIGKSGVGKTTLLQSISERISSPLKTDDKENGYVICTDSSRKLTIIDSDGFSYNNNNTISELDAIIQKQHVNRLVYCINFTSNRFEEYEASIISTLRKNNPNIKVVIVLTQCYNTKSKDFERMVTYIKSKTNYATIIPVLCVDWETDGGIKKSFGVNDVMSEVFNE